LISFEKGKPEWELLGLPKIDRLPAVQWRQQNLDKITKNKRAELVSSMSPATLPPGGTDDLRRRL
jgi:hypothetical protein